MPSSCVKERKGVPGPPARDRAVLAAADTGTLVQKMEELPQDLSLSLSHFFLHFPLPVSLPKPHYPLNKNRYALKIINKYKLPPHSGKLSPRDFL